MTTRLYFQDADAVLDVDESGRPIEGQAMEDQRRFNPVLKDEEFFQLSFAEMVTR
jgi:hypothetical protein